MHTACFLVALFVCTIGTHGRGVGRWDDIPQRCIDNSVTPVSCAQASSPDSLLPHPDDCNLFYYCVVPWASPVCRQCPAGLHFSPTDHVCDEPHHAGCRLNDTTTTTTLDYHGVDKLPELITTATSF